MSSSLTSRMLTRSDRQDEHAVLRDRSFIEEMKADILRRAEAISDDEDEDNIGLSSSRAVADVQKAADEDDIDLDGDIGRLRIVGDAGDVSDEEVDEGRETDPSPETILELAYIRDPKLFDRDAQTRRSKTRIDLKAQTGSFVIRLLTLTGSNHLMRSQDGPMSKLRVGRSCWSAMYVPSSSLEGKTYD